MSILTEKLLQAHGERARTLAQIDLRSAEERAYDTELDEYMAHAGIDHSRLLDTPAEKLEHIGELASRAYQSHEILQLEKPMLRTHEGVIREILGELSGATLRAATLSNEDMIQADRWDGEDYIHTPKFVAQATGFFKPTSWYIDNEIRLFGKLRSGRGLARKTLFHVPLVDTVTGEPLVELEEV